MNDEILLLQEEKETLVLILNRPEVMNSFNIALTHAMMKQIKALRFRSDIRTIIITGAGEKAFSAGADLKERITLTDIQVKEFITTKQGHMEFARPGLRLRK